MNQFVYEDQDAPSGQNDGAWLVGGSVGIMGLGNTKYTRGSENGKLTNYSLHFLVNTTYAYQGYYIWGETGLGAAITDGSGTNFHGSKSRTNGVFILGGGVGYSWHYWNVFFRYDHYFGKSYPGCISLLGVVSVSQIHQRSDVDTSMIPIGRRQLKLELENLWRTR